MLILGNYRVWRDIPVPGAKPIRLLIEAQEDEALNEVTVEVGAIPPSDDLVGRSQWFDRYNDALAVRSIKAWEQVGVMGPEGKPVAVECTPENVSALLTSSGLAVRVRNLVAEVNNRIHVETEAAGNVSSGGSPGIDKVARKRSKR